MNERTNERTNTSSHIIARRAGRTLQARKKRQKMPGIGQQSCNHIFTIIIISPHNAKPMKVTAGWLTPKPDLGSSEMESTYQNLSSGFFQGLRFWFKIPGLHRQKAEESSPSELKDLRVYIFEYRQTPSCTWGFYLKDRCQDTIYSTRITESVCVFSFLSI